LAWAVAVEVCAAKLAATAPTIAAVLSVFDMR